MNPLCRPVPNPPPTGPLAQVEEQLLERHAAVEAFLREQWRATPPPFYASVDLRDSGYKIAPVDTNLFPAGFNNLNPAFLPLCIQAVQTAVERLPRPVERIAIIPESHTRNLYYLENVAALRAIIDRAGFEVRLGSLIAEPEGPTAVRLPSGRSLRLEPLAREGRRLRVGDFAPDLVLLNNDLSSGLPAILDGLEQPLVPPPAMGWSRRLKSTHFAHYQKVAEEFGRRIGIDPWLIDPLFKNCGEVNFMDGTGMSCLQRRVEQLLEEIGRKYERYGITDRPFIIVKADSGTYGMGVMTVHSPEDVVGLSRKKRTRMATSKEGQAIRNVIIQEGVYTAEARGEPPAVAEPVVYMIDRNVVGGFYRLHTARAKDENLNAPGMRFEPMAECGIAPERRPPAHARDCRSYTYGVIARLALVAAARELAAIGPAP